LAAIAPIAAETRLDNTICIGNNQPYYSQKGGITGKISATGADILPFWSHIRIK